jgi:hypothetical protein
MLSIADIREYVFIIASIIGGNVPLICNHDKAQYLSKSDDNLAWTDHYF